ncbi:MAG: helix-turn-helix transcriptional regulator [Streptosporangiaceae bacterium]|jgi:transcriptional regulator with XRE-family HTH domain
MKDATEELAAFLRSRRERLEPAEAGLPPGVRPRRTPGLRREEVAELAGVSVDYVVRLEQGRGLRPSPEVLEAFARALRLSEDERVYLFDLVRQRPRERAPRATAAESLNRLVADLSPRPAMVIDHRFDILAWNDEIAALLLDFDRMPADERNMAWLCVAHPGFRDFYVDRERVVRESIADLRAAWAANSDDKALDDLITRMRAASPEFARLWRQHDVRVNGRGLKRLLHPVAGEITIEFEALQPIQDPDQRLIIYRAADERSAQRLAALARVRSEAMDDPSLAL